MRAPSLYPSSVLLLALAVTWAPVVDAQTCAVPANTLSLDCGSSCATYSPCLLKSATTCAFECFTIDTTAPSSYAAFKFLIPYDTTVGDTTSTASKINDALTKIAKLKLPSTTAQVFIVGGSTLLGNVKGVTSKVEVASDFLAANTQVNYVQLANLNLSPTLDKLLPQFPSGLTTLRLENTLLKAFPTEITSFTSLTTLFLSVNSITQVDESHVMDSLTAIHLDLNRLSSFTAVYKNAWFLDLAYNSLTEIPAALLKYKKLTTLQLSGNALKSVKQSQFPDTIDRLGLFIAGLSSYDVFLPNLERLDLSGNDFTEIPPVIFNHTTLQELNLAGNTLLTNVVLTNEQAMFISTLKTFTASPGIFSSDCVIAQQTTVKGFTVCIGEPVDKSVITATRAPVAAKNTTVNSSNSNESGSGSSNSASAGTTTTGSKKTSGAKGTGSTFNSDSTTTTDVQSSSSSNVTLIVISCVVGVVALALIAGFVYLKKHKQDSGEKAIPFAMPVTNSTVETGRSVSKMFGAYISLWNDPGLLAVKVSADEIEDVMRVGQGAFCDVWLVIYRNAQRLASKRIRESEVSHNRTQEFVIEIKLVSSLKHPSIVEFIGAAWTKESDLQALFEFMEGGDLRTYLVDERSSRPWTLEKVQFAIDIVEALVYVHSFSPPLVHRDLKSRNVLLSDQMQAKLTDFGVSRYQSEQNTMTAGVGTGKWLAPEVISGQSDYGPAADIFSFGVVLSELDSHKLPYEDLRSSSGYKMVDVALLQLISSGEIRPSFLKTCPPNIAELANCCLSFRPEDRPSAVEIAFALRTFKKNLNGGFYV